MRGISKGYRSISKGCRREREGVGGISKSYRREREGGGTIGLG